MDTDYLSLEAYNATLIEAEKFNHDLTLRFGLLSSDCKDEEEYLLRSIELARAIKKLDKNRLYDIFFGELPDLHGLNNTLDKIINNIGEVLKIPSDKRTYDEF